MTANSCSLRLHQIRGQSLDPSKVWYAVSNEWFYKPREFIRSDSFSFFEAEIAEVYIFDLTDKNGGIVDPSWFGSSRKKDSVVVATLFGIVGRAIRRKHLDADEIIASTEFQAIRDLLNSLQFDSEMAASQSKLISSSTPQPLFPTPPATRTPPEEIRAFPSFNQPIQDLQKLEPSIGPRLFVRRAGAIAKNCIDSLREHEASGSDFGKVLGYGLLYGPDESHKKFAKDVLSTALCTVAEKKGIKRTFDISVSDNLTTVYVQSLRVPDWIQLYVKLATKLPNRSWQTLLNFLNIGRSGVSYIM